MRTLLLMLGAACLLTGCGKKPKDVANNTNTGGGGGDGFMAVDGGRVVTGGGGQPAAQPQPQPPAPRGINENTNFRPGGTALGNVYRAGKRAGLMGEMQQIGQLVSVTVQVDDRMPSAAEIKADLQRSSGKLAALVADGTVILTDTKDKRGMWAYEIDSEKVGGIALVGGTPGRYTAQQITAMLQQK